MRAHAIFLAVLAIASVARAQSARDLARARARFGECVEMIDGERYVNAVACLREVMAVRSTGQVKYNLALALERLGRFAEAAELLRDTAEDRSLNRRARRDSRRLLATIEPRLAHLTIQIEGDSEGATVLLDGQEVGLDRIGAPFDVDPGSHTVRMRRGDAVVATQQVNMEEGDSSDVTLVPQRRVRLDAELPEGYALPEENRAQQRTPEITEQWWFWAALGTIAVVVITIVVAVAVSE